MLSVVINVPKGVFKTTAPAPPEVPQICDDLNRMSYVLVRAEQGILS